jgi:hypothetical protein
MTVSESVIQVIAAVLMCERAPAQLHPPVSRSCGYLHPSLSQIPYRYLKNLRYPSRLPTSILPYQYRRGEPSPSSLSRQTRDFSIRIAETSVCYSLSHRRRSSRHCVLSTAPRRSRLRMMRSRREQRTSSIARHYTVKTQTTSLPRCWATTSGRTSTSHGILELMGAKI